MSSDKQTAQRPGSSSRSRPTAVDPRLYLKDDDSLTLYLEAAAEFDRRFCDLMAGGSDFTLKMEVRGYKGTLLHARVLSDGFRRPGAEKKAGDEQ